MERAWNRHHALSCRASYKTPTERALRQHKGLIVPMYAGIHKELHAEIPHPPKPNARLIVGALHFLDGLPDIILNQPLEAISALSDHFCSQEAKVAQNIGNNLARQLIYIQDGIYDGL